MPAAHTQDSKKEATAPGGDGEAASLVAIRFTLEAAVFPRAVQVSLTLVKAGSVLTCARYSRFDPESRLANTALHKFARGRLRPLSPGPGTP
jgi:hypothetical protein